MKVEFVKAKTFKDLNKGDWFLALDMILLKYVDWTVNAARALDVDCNTHNIPDDCSVMLLEQIEPIRLRFKI